MNEQGKANKLQDEVSQSLSAWMDDELSEPASNTLFQSIVNNDQHRKSFESYHAIRAVLKNESCAHWQSGFSDKVAAAIDNEPAILAPRNMSRTRKAITGWAVAASVALSVVVGVQMYPGAPTAGTSEMLTDNSGDSATILAEYHVTEEERAQLERINTIFNQFSQQPQVSGGSLPYVRLVSGEQVKTYRMTPQQFRQVMMELEKRNREAEIKAKQQLNQGKN